MEANETKIDTWGVVEVLGRQTFAGRLSEHTIGGSALLRIDVPDIPEKGFPEGHWRHGQTLPAQPAFTKFVGIGSIYALTPCTEEVARRVAAEARKYPVDIVAMPQMALTARDAEDLEQNDEPIF